MGVITPDNNNYFKSAEFVFSKVKRNLSSFDAAGMIDEGEFPEYVKSVLKLLGIAVYKEAEAVVAVKNYKACLPDDFEALYAAYKCSPYVEASDIKHLQGQPLTFYNDVTWELMEADKNCAIETLTTASADVTILEKITVKQYVQETPVIVNYKNPILLRLSPNVKPQDCAEDCANRLSSSMYEISINGKQLLTNFTNDSVYMKYYAFPKDEDGIPMILDNEKLESAIEWCIKFNVLYNWWLNNSVPDLQNKWQDAEQRYNFWMREIRTEMKMPSFVQMVNSARKQRAVNKVQLFANLHN